MAEKDKKYYWLKLKRDFFKRHDIQIIEAMPNGKDYILFYLKLLCESVDHDGNLRFNEEIPYNEEMLSTITRTNIDIIRSAIKVFKQLNMLEVLSDGTIYMREVNKMLGSESYWAERSRVYRAKQKCLTSSNECQTRQGKSKRIDKDIDKDTETETETDRDLDDFNNKENTINQDRLDSIFKDVLEELSKTIPAISYETFFSSLKAIGTQGHLLVLEGAELFRNAIDERLSDRVKVAITKATKGNLTGYAWLTD